LRCLKQRKFSVKEICVLARSDRRMEVDGEGYEVKAIAPERFEGVDFALFAGTEGEKGAAVTYAAEAVKRGAVVIDNGADFRMDKDVPLVVPEVNPGDALRHKGIIANPNCSTIQMVVALSPIHRVFGLKRVVVTTLQAASGAGKSAVEQLKEEVVNAVNSNFEVGNLSSSAKAMPQQLGFNVFPQIGGFAEDDYTSEEWKLVKETHKIMHDDKICVSATTVRVPVIIGHSEAVYLETSSATDVQQIRKVLSGAPGIVMVDDTVKGLYPMPKDCAGRDEVFVGRLRRDPYVKNGFWLWVVADNLRKGAAANAVQIAEILINPALHS
jgi:aspartate-semialdehyde dehydrogenase